MVRFKKVLIVVAAAAALAASAGAIQAKDGNVLDLMGGLFAGGASLINEAVFDGGSFDQAKFQ